MFQFWTAVLRKLDQKYHNVELGCYSGAFFLVFDMLWMKWWMETITGRCNNGLHLLNDEWETLITTDLMISETVSFGRLHFMNILV